MPFLIHLALWTTAITPLLANPLLVRETGPLTPEEERQGFTVPNDFEVQLFAAEPMINKPINLAWDRKGRLWVSSTVEYPYGASKDRWLDEKGSRVKDSRDAIKILEDVDGDGKADKVINFADGLNIPTGVLPWHKPEHKEGCIAWSIPNIWYFADTTGDGKADLREVLFGPMGWERDTHGMCSSFRMGPDGWVYATHGFNNTSTATARDGSRVEMHSGNVFRFKPDGSRIEIWSRGQVNPFGLCFDKRGNLYSADCHSAPIYQLIRGACYPSFGKPHDGMGFGPTMIEHTHGSTGICGLAFVDRNQWGRRWNYRMLIGNPVNSVINHDGIKFVGTTPVAVEQPDFMTSKDLWFRPVDLCLGGDGALYVADFYNKIIGHYEVPLDHPDRDRERGRIWRVVYKGGAASPGPISPPSLSKNPVDDLQSRTSFIRRAAADYLQQHPRAEALVPLLELYYRERPDDTHLRHVLRLAIRAQLTVPGALQSEAVARLLPTDIALASGNEQSAAFLLRRLQGGPRLRQTPEILEYVAHHGSSKAVEEAITWVQEQSARPLEVRAQHLKALFHGLQERPDPRPDTRLVSLGQEIARGLLEEGVAHPWMVSPHPSALEDPSPWVLQKRRCEDGMEVNVISSLPIGRAQTERLRGVLRSIPFKAPASLSFWLCGHRGAPEQPAHEKNYVRLVEVETGKELQRSFPPRSDVAKRIEWDLSASEGSLVQLEVVDGDNANAFAWLAVTRLEPAVAKVESFRNSVDRVKLLQELARPLVTSAPATLRKRLQPYLPPVPAPAPAPVSEDERSRLDALIAKRTASFARARPNLTRGSALFTAHCANCHQVNGEGALLGPQLDGIGARGAARLSEDILDPNRNVDAHFYLTSLKLGDGSTTAGFVRDESAATLLLMDTAGKEHRLQKDQITSRETVPMSLMPSTFEHLLPEEQFNDLLGWLLSQKTQ